MALTVQNQRRVAKTGVMIGLMLGAVFAAGPVLWMLSSSFKSNTQIFEHRTCGEHGTEDESDHHAGLGDATLVLHGESHDQSLAFW